MKKIITLTILIFSCFLLIGCNNSSKYLKELSFNDLYKKIENKETFILEISQDGCSHCAAFNPVFKKVLEENQVTAHYLNVSKLNEEQYLMFLDDFNYGEDLGTPTVMFITDGHEKTKMNRLIGQASEKEITRKLKQNDYIK